MWIIVPVAIFAMNETIEGQGGTKGQAYVATYIGVILLVALVVKLLSVLDNAYHARLTRDNPYADGRSPAEAVIVVSTLFALFAVTAWFLATDACAGSGMYVCG